MLPRPAHLKRSRSALASGLMSLAIFSNTISLIMIMGVILPLPLQGYKDAGSAWGPMARARACVRSLLFCQRSGGFVEARHCTEG